MSNLESWKENRQWLADNEYDIELKDISNQISVLSIAVQTLKGCDEFTCKGIAGLMDTVSNRLLDLAHGRLPHERLPE